MADVLIDTDIFIDHLRGHRELVLGKHRAHISALEHPLSVVTRNVKGFEKVRGLRLRSLG